MTKETIGVMERGIIEQLQQPSFEVNPWQFLFPEGGEKPLAILEELALDNLKDVTILRVMPERKKIRSCWLGIGKEPEIKEVDSLDCLEEIFRGGKARGIVFFTQKSGRDICPELLKLKERLSWDGRIWILEEVGQEGLKEEDKKLRRQCLKEEGLSGVGIDELKKNGCVIWKGENKYIPKILGPYSEVRVLTCGECGQPAESATNGRRKLGRGGKIIEVEEGNTFKCSNLDCPTNNPDNRD